MSASSYFVGLGSATPAYERGILVGIAGQRAVAGRVVGGTTQVSVVDQPARQSSTVESQLHRRQQQSRPLQTSTPAHLNSLPLSQTHMLLHCV